MSMSLQYYVDQYYNLYDGFNFTEHQQENKTFDVKPYQEYVEWLFKIGHDTITLSIVAMFNDRFGILDGAFKIKAIDLFQCNEFTVNGKRFKEYTNKELDKIKILHIWIGERSEQRATDSLDFFKRDIHYYNMLHPDMSGKVYKNQRVLINRFEKFLELKELDKNLKFHNNIIQKCLDELINEESDIVIHKKLKLIEDSLIWYYEYSIKEYKYDVGSPVYLGLDYISGIDYLNDRWRSPVRLGHLVRIVNPKYILKDFQGFVRNYDDYIKQLLKSPDYLV